MIGLLGATGYTGRLVCAELARREVPHVRAGRSAARLAALEPSPHATTAVVDTSDPAALAAFLDGVDTVISCVGPFATLGLPVVDAAVAAGVAYVDSTGEPEFMAEVYRRHAAAPTPVVPACGFDYLPGDLAVALACQELGGTAEEVDVTYRVSGMRPSRGTARSALGAATAATAHPRRYRAAFPAGEVWAVELPWGEATTVPLHQPGATVRTGVVLGDRVSQGLALTAPAARFARPLLRAAGPLLDRLVDRLPEGPAEDRRAAVTFAILAEARSGRRTARVQVTGRDVYLLTALLLVEAAQRVGGAGALPPAAALDPRPFLDAVSGDLLQWETL